MRGRGWRLIVVNATFALAPWADVCYAADYRFWEVYIADIIACGFKGELWSVSEQARQKWGTFWIRQGASEGLHPDPDTINGGGNSGFQSTHLAATFGSRRIGMLGFDMQDTQLKHHWHGKHKGGLPNGKGFSNWLDRFAYLARDLRKVGVKTYNCTRTTAMECFDRKSLEEVIDEFESDERREREIARVQEESAGDLERDAAAQVP